MKLQTFVTDVIEALGGVVVPVEYALCQALIPEEYKSYFQNRTEIELSFDYEVAQENPQSEFVTFGSYILDQVLALANRKPVHSLRFVEVDRLSVGQPLKKIKNFLGETGDITIESERHVFGAWGVFQFRVMYVADEKEELRQQVWVDLITGHVSEEMETEQNRIVYAKEPSDTLPFPETLDMMKAFQTAYHYAVQVEEKEKDSRLQDIAFQKDIDRIQTYYDELLQENEQRAARKGLKEETKAALQAKSKAIQLERDKQLQEIKNKYDIQIDISLDHSITYFIPVLKYEVCTRFRGKQKDETLYYNPIIKQFAVTS
jgi:hypothetical protein